MKNTIAGDCWKAAARMDATIMGDCYGPMRAKAAAKYEPRPQKPEKIPRNGTSLAWDELSVCTDDSETTAGADTEKNVFGTEITGLATTVIYASKCAAYPTTQSTVNRKALNSLADNLRSVLPALRIVAEYAHYAGTRQLDNALVEMYEKLRSKTRLVKPVYGYPSRQVKVFYAAGMRERSVCKKMYETAMSKHEFLEACIALRQPAKTSVYSTACPV